MNVNKVLEATDYIDDGLHKNLNQTNENDIEVNRNDGNIEVK